MARYGTFRYAEDTYGEDTTTANLWALEIDWTGAGYDGSNESERMISCNVTRGRGYVLNSGGNGFQRVQPGRMNITLENYDQRYDPYNEDSPLYGYLLPGKSFRLRVKNGTAGDFHDIMAGYIDDIQPISSRACRIIGVDTLETLNQALVSHADIETAVRVDDTVEDILTDAGVTLYDVDQMSDIIPYWWMDKVTATYALGELEDLVIGVFFIASDGTAKFYSRRRLGEETVAILESDDILREIVINQPWELVRNQIETPVNPRQSQAEAELFSITDVVEVSAGESVTIWAAYRYDNEQVPALSVSVTEPSSDFKVYDDTGGVGSDLTASCTLTVTAFAESAKLVVANGSASTGYITALNVRGEPLTNPNPLTIRDEDTDSIAIYGTRKLVIDSKWQQDTNDAIDRTSTLINIFADVRRNPVIQIEGRSDLQFGLDLFDRVSLMVPYLSIDTAYRIGSIKHDWASTNGQTVITTLTLEELVDYAAAYWNFPTNIGQTTYFA